MLDILCFRGRVGRLRYFLSSIGYGLGIGVLAFVLLLLFVPHTSRGQGASITGFIIPLIIVVPLALWVIFSLQAARLRDIGWSPALVLPGWLLFTLIDAFIAYKIPDWSIGSQHHTAIGVAVNAALTLLLLFMPGSGEDDTPSYISTDRLSSNWATGSRSGGYQSTGMNPTSLRGQASASRSTSSGKVGFGRRGLQ
jgi:uncharacterized membrane protein YhaH (DUF805 family)